MHFGMKNTLKSNHNYNHTPKQDTVVVVVQSVFPLEMH